MPLTRDVSHPPLHLRFQRHQSAARAVTWFWGQRARTRPPLRLKWRRDHRSLGFVVAGFSSFHRYPARSVDEADIATRAETLANFIEVASSQYGFARAPIAFGF